MKTKVVLYGASGHCKTIIDTILNSDTFEIDSIIDDNNQIDSLCGYKIIHSELFNFSKKSFFFISIGNNQIRKNIVDKLKVEYKILIHKNASVSSIDVSIGEGTVIATKSIINPSAKIGKHCIINSGAIIEHDCFIHDFAHICPGAKLAGGVEIGEGSMIGIGASIIQGIKIGKWAIIGAGAVIIEDVPNFAFVVGVPGRVTKIIE